MDWCARPRGARTALAKVLARCAAAAMRWRPPVRQRQTAVGLSTHAAAMIWSVGLSRLWSAASSSPVLGRASRRPGSRGDPHRVRWWGGFGPVGFEPVHGDPNRTYFVASVSELFTTVCLAQLCDAAGLACDA